MKKTEEVEVGYVPHFEVVNWSPKARIAAVAAGVAALVLGQRIQGVGRQVFRFVGVSLGLRGLFNKDLTQVIGTVLSPTIRLRREIIVDAPFDEISAFLTKIANYPRFMSFVRNVETSRFGNLIWEISGPGGIPIRWETFILSWSPGGTIAWRTVPGSPVYNAGRVTIQPLEFGQCKVAVELAYAVRGGGLGYAAVRVLGFDPRSRIESDLNKMKLLIEEGWREKGNFESQYSGAN